MKKLLDESPDDLTRALLEAGRSQRPPAGNQAKLLMALGAGAGVGLFSSKAFAWLSTSAGKVTLVSSITLGLAGAAYLALPAPQPAQQASRRMPAEAALAAEAALEPAPTVPALVADAPAVAATSFETTAGAPSLPGSSSGAMSVPAHRAHAPAASERRHRTAEQRRRIATRRDDVDRQASVQRTAAAPTETETELAGPLPAVPAPPPAVDARAPGLDSEIQLVDAMRGAAHRNDSAALRRLLEAYRGQFPEGQLRQEVAELALRSSAH
jgi:hypothetical protein